MDRARVDVRCADIDAFLHLEAFLCQAEYKPPSSSSSSSVAWYYNAAALTSSSADAAASSAPPPPPTPSSPTPSSPPARGHFRRQSAGVDNPRQLVDVVVGTHDRLGAELVTCLLPTENRIIVDCAAILHSSILENSGVQPSDWLVRVGTAELNLVGLFEVDATTQRVLKTQPAAKLAVALEAIDKLGQTSTKTRSAYEEQAERALTEHFGEGADDVLQRRVDVYVLINLLNSVMLVRIRAALTLYTRSSHPFSLSRLYACPPPRLQRRIAWICSNAPRPLSLRFTRAAAGDYSKGVVSEIVLEDDDDGAATSAAKKKQALLARTRSEPMVMARLGGSQTVTVEIAAAGKLGVTLGVDPVTGAVIVVSIAQGGLVAQGVQAECSGSSRHFLDRRSVLGERERERMCVCVCVCLSRFLAISRSPRSALSLLSLTPTSPLSPFQT